MATWPTTPIPHEIAEEPLDDPAMVIEFDGGIEQRRSRWHRAKHGFMLTYKALVSVNSSTQAIADHTIIRDFIIARRFKTEAFTFVHPYYPSSIYVCRYDDDILPQTRVSRVHTDISSMSKGGTDVFDMTVKLREIF